MAWRSHWSGCSRLPLPRKLTEPERGGGARSPESQLIRPTPFGTRERPLAEPPRSCARWHREGSAPPAPTGAAPLAPHAPPWPTPHRPPGLGEPQEGESGARGGTVQDQGKLEDHSAEQKIIEIEEVCL
nr:proline-rich protein 2-like isoform X2 [Marmota flaviventris]